MKRPEELALDWIADNRVESIPQPVTSAFLAGYQAAKAIVEDELQAVQAQRVERPGLGSAEYALKSVLAKMGANENT